MVFILSKMASPIPETFFISSTVLNPPFCVRYSTIDLALASPIPDNFVSSSAEAVLIFIKSETLKSLEIKRFRRQVFFTYQNVFIKIERKMICLSKI